MCLRTLGQKPTFLCQQLSKGAVPVALLNIRTVPEEGGQVVLPATSEKT